MKREASSRHLGRGRKGGARARLQLGKPDPQSPHAKRLLAEKLRAMEQLVGGLAHEFNNLLAGTMNYAELLRHFASTCGVDDAIEHVDGILENTRRASELVGRLSAFARASTHESVPVDVQSVLDEVVEEAIAEDASHLDFDLEAQAADSFVVGDARALKNALANLVANAREAMPRGGTLAVRTAVVELGDEDCQQSLLPIRRGNYLRIDVEDSGVGIEPELLGRIFEPFYTTKRTAAAAGLGLAVVHGIIREHGGTLEVSSTLGVGTRVRVHLPISGQVPIATLRPADEVVKGSGCLLLADDEPSLRRSTAALLRQLGYEVVLAQDGAEAVALFRREPSRFDLVLLDIMMPKLNGRDALREMRRIDPTVKAMYVSGFGLGGEEPSTEEGVQGVLRKPFTAATLSQRIANALESPSSSIRPGDKSLVSR